MLPNYDKGVMACYRVEGLGVRVEGCESRSEILGTSRMASYPSQAWEPKALNPIEGLGFRVIPRARFTLLTAALLKTLPNSINLTTGAGFLYRVLQRFLSRATIRSQDAGLNN